MSSNGNPHFHLTEEQYLRNIEMIFENARIKNQISEADEISIRKFLEDKENDAKASRLYKLADTLVLNREFFPEYLSCSTDDYKEGIRRLRMAKKIDGTPRFKPNTINDRAKIMRSFFIFLARQDKNARKLQKLNKSHWLHHYVDQLDIDAEELKEYKLPKPEKITKTEEDIYTPEEIMRMINACYTARERAIVTLLYETGCRISEIGGLKWGQVDKNCQYIETDGKTGKHRYIPITMSMEALLEWKKDYPMDPNKPDAFVFVNYRRCIQQERTYSPLSYQAYSKLLKTIGEMANIERPIKPHNFRHTRITHLLKDGLDVEAICLMMWGSLHSNMLDVYGHIGKDDVKEKYAKHYGLSPESLNIKNKGNLILKPIECPHCHNICGPTSEFCSRCGTSLTENAKKREENLRDELRRCLQDEEICSAAFKRMKKNASKVEE